MSRRRIIPLPQWKANPETDPEALFQKEQLVLALYPQTTCFYRALIHTPPQRVRQPPWERPSMTAGLERCPIPLFLIASLNYVEHDALSHTLPCNPSSPVPSLFPAFRAVTSTRRTNVSSGLPLLLC